MHTINKLIFYRHVPRGKRPLGKSRNRWVESSQMVLGEIG
jgi:hypothetical protein